MKGKSALSEVEVRWKGVKEGRGELVIYVAMKASTADDVKRCGPVQKQVACFQE